jgi:uncharacterized membrane protein YdbT with pleckstrin-like domain
MFCIICGANNRDGAVYCQKCGNSLEAEEETRVAKKVIEADKTADEEKQIFKISPTLIFVKIGYALAVFGAFLLVAILIFIGQLTGFYVPAWLSVLLGILLLLIPAFYHFKQKLVSYTLTDSKIEIDSGLVSRSTRNVPIRTILDVTVSASVPQRMLGIGNLIVENANESDEKIILKNINTPKKYADVLLKQMRLLDK